MRLRLTITIVASTLLAAVLLPSRAAFVRAETPEADDVAEEEAPPPAKPGPEVRYEDGRLTIRATETPLDALLADIARVTGAEIRGTAPPTPVSTKLDAVPFAEALNHILRDVSFMLTYDGTGKPRTINLIDRGGTQAARAAAGPTPGPQSSGALVEEENQAKIIQKPVPISPTLAHSLEMESPSPGQLMIAAMGDARPKVRSEAREALIAAVNFDTELEAAYLSTLKPVSDATLAKQFRGMAKESGAEELLEALAGRARSPELRQKAAAILVKLRQTPR